MTAGSISGDPMQRKRVAVLISGRGSNMAALIEAAKDKNYPAEIVLVLSNRPDAAGLATARAAGIATEVVAHTTYGKDRAAFDAAVQAELAKHRIDIVCLAGFMRLLTPGFVAQWPQRMLNIHPALLPAFKGLDTHKRALAADVKVHGATVHFVTAELDAGPIIVQAAVAVCKDDDEAALAARVLSQEHRIYPLALKLLAEGRVRVENGRCLIDGVPVPNAAQLKPVC
jgi:phosphoribosylglycinamide formyltransferase 1